MNIIKKLFIKDYKNVCDPQVRARYGIAAGIVGIVCNVLLFAFKLAVGLIGGSITIVADAVNNLSDAGSSVVTFIGFKLAKRPADAEHPYGHARYEYITGLLVSFFVLAIGILLAKSSIEKMITPTAVTVSAFTFAVLAVSIAAKLLLMILYRDFGKSINSDALKAAGTDSFNDIIATAAVLLSSIIIKAAGVNVDAYFGLAVSLFIIFSAVKLIKETTDPLLGKKPDKELICKIKDKILSYEGILGIHDLMVHNYGEGCYFASVHAEVDAKVDIMVSHDLMDKIERDFEEELNIKLSIHMDPVETDDEYVNEFRIKALEAVAKLDCRLTLHDFRVVRCLTHSNILFDAVIPFGCEITKEEIEAAVKEAISDPKHKFYFIIGIDRDYI
jgi:cation diffusion facilitator family transporter